MADVDIRILELNKKLLRMAEARDHYLAESQKYHKALTLIARLAETAPLSEAVKIARNAAAKR